MTGPGVWTSIVRQPFLLAVWWILTLSPGDAHLATVQQCSPECEVILSCNWWAPEDAYDWIGTDFLVVAGVVTLTCVEPDYTLSLYRLDWRLGKAGTVQVSWSQPGKNPAENP